MAFDTKLLEIIACPVCKGKLRFDKENAELISTAAKLAYPVRDDIPAVSYTHLTLPTTPYV